ncbi:alpha/beta hydrolase [Bacillus sp. OK048]|uniref:alpha/beta hydrolase n=1 Tax=Bacillus sp. OK048 TaxID=1882761 RepID=UPI000B84C0F0|nr:alpha/beta fold hydrolase [Bacillus sp. OK048]
MRKTYVQSKVTTLKEGCAVVEIKHFEVLRDGMTIRGMMTKPEGEGPFPAVIFNHGFTGHKGESHFIFKKLADVLADKGIVSFRFDFIGNGESDGQLIDMTMTSEVKDCLAIFDYAVNFEYVDANFMNLLGFSMGGAVSILAASILHEQVKKLILLSPAANMQDVLSRKLYGEALLHYIETGAIDLGGNVVGKSLLEDVFGLNIYEAAKQVTAEVQLIHGTHDDAVPPLVSWRLAEIFAEKGSLHWIHGSDHCYTSARYETEVIDVVKNFFG